VSQTGRLPTCVHSITQSPWRWLLRLLRGSCSVLPLPLLRLLQCKPQRAARLAPCSSKAQVGGGDACQQRRVSQLATQLQRGASRGQAFQARFVAVPLPTHPPTWPAAGRAGSLPPAPPAAAQSAPGRTCGRKNHGMGWGGMGSRRGIYATGHTGERMQTPRMHAAGRDFH
jgi:hypothetical protein